MEQPPFSWNCPYCRHDAVIRKEELTDFFEVLTPQAWDGTFVFTGRYIVCPNPQCRRYSLSVELLGVTSEDFRGLILSRVYATTQRPTGWVVKRWRLVPSSNAKVFPPFVPRPITADYEEACLIRELSPKAAATLARRALQGMIRDYWKISRPNLKQEIEAIKDNVDELTWKAIEGVRQIGNIGAHMEADVNVIVDVDPIEAEKLLWLIEFLVDEWYVRREERTRRLAEIASIATSKKV
jgi:hypothetical protein